MRSLYKTASAPGYLSTKPEAITIPKLDKASEPISTPFYFLQTFRVTLSPVTMYSKTSSVLGAVAFMALVNQVAAGPFIAVALLAGIVGGSAAGAACSAGACKRAAETLVKEVELCSADIATATPSSIVKGSTVTVKGVPPSCITLATNYNALANESEFSALAKLGVAKVIDAETLEIDLNSFY
jgi:hypothetical protein